MSSTSIETTLELWASSLRDVPAAVLNAIEARLHGEVVRKIH
jgi:hypothetical protein